MELGAGFPQRAIGRDSGALRDYVQGVEQLGYAHMRAADHVLGADPGQYELEGPYTHDAMFREPFVMFGYAAALTSSIKLVTSVLILSQRQTALVAKQAAEVDLLSARAPRTRYRQRLEHRRVRGAGRRLRDARLAH